MKRQSGDSIAALQKTPLLFGAPPWIRADPHEEVDFVLLRRGKKPIAIECKWRADQFDGAGLQAFRRRYPEGLNFLISEDTDRSYKRHIRDLEVAIHSLKSLVDEIA